MLKINGLHLKMKEIGPSQKQIGAVDDGWYLTGCEVEHHEGANCSVQMLQQSGSQIAEPHSALHPPAQENDHLKGENACTVTPQYPPMTAKSHSDGEDWRWVLKSSICEAPWRDDRFG